MGERRTDRGDEDEWLPVIPPAYVAARRRHTVAREEAYVMACEDAVARRICGPALHMTDVDEHALAAWRRTWRGREHPSGAGGWDWPLLLERLPHRAAVLPIAIWYGDDLCGMALGLASKRRWNGSRHTITLTHIERRPEPPAVPLKGHVVSLAAEAALQYGLNVGARRLRLRNPDRRLLDYYEGLGFEIVWDGDTPIYCEQEVFR